MGRKVAYVMAHLYPRVGHYNMIPTCMTWALDTLKNLGYSVEKCVPKMILNSPWSRVYRFNTDQGYLYLKQVSPALFLEV